MKFVVLLGRILFSAIFFLASFNQFTSGAINYAARQGIALPNIVVPLWGIICFMGALSVLLGYKAKIGAWFLVAFLLPITFMFHQFWNNPNPNAAIVEQVMFIKNLSLIGGAMIIAYFGTGPYSLDSSKKK